MSDAFDRPADCRRGEGANQGPRSDTEMPQFNNNSAVMRSSPQVRFALAIWVINC